MSEEPEPLSKIIWTPPSTDTIPEPQPTRPEREDIPPNLVDAARILARELEVTVYLTRRGPASGGLLVSGGPSWCITLQRDNYDSEACLEPDGRKLECDVYC